MLRTLLLAGCAAIGSLGFAQCVPNSMYADSVYGVWPDTITNFSSGMQGVFYSDTLQILVPSDAGLIVPGLSGITVDSVALAQVNGLPPGITAVCNSQTNGPCTYITGQVGCALLEGTPTQTGTFNITIQVVGYFQLGGTQQYPASFTGYRIVVGDNTTGMGDVTPAKLGRVQNVPNPFVERTNIEFSLSKSAPVKVKVYNLVGEKMWSRTVQGKAGVNRVPFEPAGLENGIYIYRVEAPESNYTGRMMVNR